MNNYMNDMLRDCSVLAINKSLPFPTIPSDVAFRQVEQTTTTTIKMKETIVASTLQIINHFGKHRLVLMLHWK